MLDDIKTIKKLTETLYSMKECVERIFEIEEQKYEAIKNMEMESLVAFNEEESMLIQKVDHIEKQRLKFVATLSTTIGCDPNTSISQLAPLLPKDHQQKILEISSAIKVICSRLDAITERNEYILKNNSEVLNQLLDIAQGTSQEQYNSQGLTTEVKKQSLHMLDQLI